jgi:hypothetical protein
MSDLDPCQFAEEPVVDLDTSGVGNQHTNVTNISVAKKQILHS